MSVAKLQDSDRGKKKKKQNLTNTKALKPNKLSLQPNTEFRNTVLASPNLLSPTNVKKTLSSEVSQGTLHQKPIILQRSKTATNTRLQTAEVSVSGFNNPKSIMVTSQSISSVSQCAASSPNELLKLSVEDKGITATSSTSIKSSQAFSSPNNTYILQKMKFKTPVSKSKAKQMKPKPVIHVQRPSKSGATHSVDSLNVLGTSTGRLVIS